MSSNRRDFLKKTTMAAAGISLSSSINAMSALSYNNIIGANDRINVAIQGLGRRYGAFINGIVAKESNARILYLCDAMQGQMDKAATKIGEKINYKPKLEEDVKKILTDKDVDAIFMATPDHWHTPGAIMAMQAGKHVYLEKPCSHNAWENQLIVTAQQKYNKVVQMGNQQRSSPESIKIVNEIHNGIIGNAYKAIAFYANGRPKVPHPVKAAPPEGLNWDLFQGPSPRKEYTHDTWNYNWHWYGWDFGTAEMGNNATHELDIARWALDVNYPKHVDVLAGKNYFKDDGWEMYDEMLATFEFENEKIIQWDGVSRNRYNKYGRGRGTLIMGTEGSVMVDRNGYERFNRKGELVDSMKSGSTEGGVALGGGGSLSTRHTINFFDAIRGKAKLTSPIEVGAMSQMLTHYANISYRIDKGFDVDQQSGRIFDRDAMKLWSRAYEPGWEPKI
ncbi:Tat (twin-arginine translocation) pathway signal sequence [Lutibacter agarilyticus]|uniref:Tat (Twin-arginine translocation) pathway signal sequence n=1 Tax=Lutibacter agarilyticus TaxID=1109740 RepID=A0A238Y4F6_9FLAO|nr:Gfo/Idh/MocA family oxidoreductase [Lutibacter agarilyticus]SNR65862.1 Tat (twin-arginine translocation) pathway signal sequence [Lutibacter agarilyticus]